MTFYYTLITSLPRYGRQFKVKQTPISRIQLEKRLKLLSKDEQTLLKQIEFLLWQSWFLPDFPLHETIAKTKQLLALDQPFLKDMINWFIDLRSLLTAIRLRKTQQVPPSKAVDYWFGNLNTRLINHWNEPDFGLRFVYPWLAEASKKIANNDSATLEDIFLTQLWKHLDVIECRHYFDFEALIIYLLRWDIVNYWSKFNETLAIERINKLVNQALEASKGEPNKGYNA